MRFWYAFISIAVIGYTFSATWRQARHLSFILETLKPIFSVIFHLQFIKIQSKQSFDLSLIVMCSLIWFVLIFWQENTVFARDVILVDFHFHKPQDAKLKSITVYVYWINNCWINNSYFCGQPACQFQLVGLTLVTETRILVGRINRYYIINLTQGAAVMCSKITGVAWLFSSLELQTFWVTDAQRNCRPSDFSQGFHVPSRSSELLGGSVSFPRDVPQQVVHRGVLDRYFKTQGCPLHV